jgi:hypothetical protein
MVALAAALSSCVSFSNGLVENPMPVDGRLIGYWEIVSTTEKGTLLIEADGPSAISVVTFDDAACTKIDRYSATRTEIAGHEFLDITEVMQDGKPVGLGPVGYEFPDSNRLSVFFPDPKIFEQAVATGALSGTVSKDKDLNGKEYTLVKIEASTADLRQWIAVHLAAMHASFAQFERRELSLVPQCRNDIK